MPASASSECTVTYSTPLRASALAANSRRDAGSAARREEMKSVSWLCSSCACVWRVGVGVMGVMGVGGGTGHSDGGGDLPPSLPPSPSPFLRSLPPSPSLATCESACAPLVQSGVVLGWGGLHNCPPFPSPSSPPPPLPPSSPSLSPHPP